MQGFLTMKLLKQSVIIGLILGTLFFQMGYDKAGSQNRISLLFFCITFNVCNLLSLSLDLSLS